MSIRLTDVSLSCLHWMLLLFHLLFITLLSHLLFHYTAISLTISLSLHVFHYHYTAIPYHTLLSHLLFHSYTAATSRCQALSRPARLADRVEVHQGDGSVHLPLIGILGRRRRLAEAGRGVVAVTQG